MQIQPRTSSLIQKAARRMNFQVNQMIQTIQTMTGDVGGRWRIVIGRASVRWRTGRLGRQKGGG